MSISKSPSFYRNLNLKRCLLMSSPFLAAALASQDLSAQLTINVTTAAQLRAAITTVNGSATNDTINVAAGGYGITAGALENANVSGDFDITKATGNLLIAGAGASTTFIDGTTFDRVFHINAGAASTITIQNLTIRTGRATDNGTVAGEGRGGGILVEQGSLALVGVEMLNNGAVGAAGGPGAPGTPGSASGVGTFAVGGAGGAGNDGSPARGGAVHFAGGTLQLSSCSLVDNVAVGGAGGVGGVGGQAIGDYNATGGNGGTAGDGGAAEGGGIFLAAGTLNQVASTISGGGVTGGAAGNGGNGGNAGGVANLTGSNYLVCFGGNGGAGGSGGAASGGGVFASSGTLNLTNSTFSGPGTTAGDGGDGGNGGNATGISGAISVFNLGGSGANGGNSGNSSGGGIFANGGTLAISNITVAGGTATAGAAGAGGAAGTGAYASGSPGGGGSALASAGGGMFIGGGTVTVNSSIFADGTAGANSDVEGTYTADNSLIENGQAPASGSANITGTDPGLAALANNGGPTQTHAITGTSAAANVGSNPLALTTDQRGTGFVRPVGAGTDMGAFEIQAAGGQTTAPIVTNPATIVTINAATFNVQGTAVADSLVRVYSDLDNNGAINGADAVVGSQQLTGGATAYSVSVPLTQDAPNDFTVTADDATNTESNPTNVLRITEDSTAPAGLVVTTPAAPVNTVGASFNIIGTAEANSLVQIYSDANNNGLIDGADAVVASGTATGGNFNVATPIALGTANNFTATAEDAAGNESGPTDVPTITETTALTNPPVVTTPSAPVTVNAATFSIIGTAVADSMVRIYSDANNNGLIDGADANVGQQQLTGGGTAFSIAVTLTQNAANNFTATADDAANPESNPVNVPTITDNNGGGNNGGNKKKSGGCSTGESSRTGWLAFGAMFAAMFVSMRQVFRRKQS